MKPRYRTVFGAMPDTTWVSTADLAAETRFTPLDLRLILNALEHQGLVERTDRHVRLTAAGRRVKARSLCIPSA